jgi:hypothetical protein
MANGSISFIVDTIQQMLTHVKEHAINDERLRYTLYLSTLSMSMNVLVTYLKTHHGLSDDVDSLVKNVQNDIKEICNWLNQPLVTTSTGGFKV